MENDNLLLSMQRLLENSNYYNSQQLFIKIVDMAAKKLCSSKNINRMKFSKMYSPIINQQKAKLIKKQGLKRKAISKRKLKLMILSKIAKQNKRIHQKAIEGRQQQLLKRQKHQQSCKAPDIRSEFCQQEQKLQQGTQQDTQTIKESDSTYEQGCLIERSKPFNLCLSQKFKNSRKNFQDYLQSGERGGESIVQEISCPICIDILIDPVSTICGHSFCFKCLDQSMLFGSNCPVCRLPIKGLQIMPCQYLNKLIKMKCYEFADHQQLSQSYRVRKAQRNEWKLSRIVDIDKITQGIIMDVRDTQNIWCKARVVKIYYLNRKITSILVHYLQWAKLYDEVIQIKSTRLAPKDHFSARTDLPRYNLNSEEENLRGAVITGNNEHIQQMNQGQNFSNIIQLDNLRNSINIIRNNISNLRNEAISSQANHQVINFSRMGNRVNFLHRYVDVDPEASNQSYQAMYEFSQSSADIVIIQNEAQHGIQENSDQSSSLGSFQFRPASQDIAHLRPQREAMSVDEPPSQQFYHHLWNRAPDEYIVIDQDLEQHESPGDPSSNDRMPQNELHNQDQPEYLNYDRNPSAQIVSQYQNQNNNRSQQSNENMPIQPPESGSEQLNV